MKRALLLILILIMGGCSSTEERMNSKAMEEIERGRYTQAAFILRDAVEINPEYLEGMVNYRNIYPIAVERTEQRLSLYGEKKDYILEAETYEDMMKLKEGLYTMSPVVHNKLSLSLKIPDYDEIKGLQETAGISYYNAGNTFEGLKLDRYGRRRKYFLYSRGEELNRTYKDIGQRTETSLAAARIFASFMPVGGGVDDSILRRVDGSALPRIKNMVLGDSKLKRIVTFKDLPEGELKENLRRASNLSESELRHLNTVIRVNVDNLSYSPTRVTRSFYTRTWTERYYVIENDVKVAKYRERSYTEIVYDKKNSSEVTLSYEMIDLENGRTIGSGVYSGISGDRYIWSEIRGKAPSGVRSGFEREIKSGDTIINEAILKAAELLGTDIKNNI